VVGRAISVEAPTALNATRGIVTGAVTGQAAGVAAALAVKRGQTPRLLDVQVIRTTLAEQGVLLRLPARGPAVHPRGKG
jgi:hypothetical protein